MLVTLLHISWSALYLTFCIPFQTHTFDGSQFGQWHCRRERHEAGKNYRGRPFRKGAGSLAILYTSLYLSVASLCVTLQLRGVGPGVAYWLRRCATSRTVPGSIPGSVTVFFSDIFPSDRTMTLGSNQLLVKMSSRNIPGGKAAGVWGWQPHHLHVPNVVEILKPKSPGTLWATPGLLRDCCYSYCNTYTLSVTGGFSSW